MEPIEKKQNYCEICHCHTDDEHETHNEKNMYKHMLYLFRYMKKIGNDMKKNCEDALCVKCHNHTNNNRDVLMQMHTLFEYIKKIENNINKMNKCPRCDKCGDYNGSVVERKCNRKTLRGWVCTNSFSRVDEKKYENLCDTCYSATEKNDCYHLQSYC